MAGGRLLVFVGLVCMALSVRAQTDPLAALAAIPPIDSLGAGSYLVNGTGLVYDTSKITLYVNGVPISYLPLDKASAPGPSKGAYHDDHEDDKDDEDKDDKDDKDDEKLPEEEKPLLPKPEIPDKTVPSAPPPVLAPGSDSQTMEPMLPKGSEEKPGNPLYSVVIGRKLKL